MPPSCLGDPRSVTVQSGFISHNYIHHKVCDDRARRRASAFQKAQENQVDSGEMRNLF